MKKMDEKLWSVIKWTLFVIEIILICEGFAVIRSNKRK